jgi:hypothetical protein
MLNKIMLLADAQSQRARLTSAGTACTGHLAVAGSAGAGLVVRTRPWLISDVKLFSGVTRAPYAASISFTQAPSAAAASGLCARKQDQEKARRTAAIGGALGPLPPRDPV